MKKSMLITIVLTAGGLLLGAAQPIRGEQPVSANKHFYEACISEAIYHAENKAALQRSDSANLRAFGAMSAQKAHYLKTNKTRLVQELDEKKVDPKRYKVHYFINHKFHNERLHAAQNQTID